jgi:transcriptional regulator with XRE-family HTH domain
VPSFDTPGARLRALREESGLSRDAAGERAGVRGQTLYRYEERGMVIGSEHLLALADLFATDARWIVRGDPPDERISVAFAEFERRIAPTIDPPMRLGERGKLIWMRHHDARPERYMLALLDERAGESPEDAAASAAATATARARGAKATRLAAKPKPPDAT